MKRKVYSQQGLSRQDILKSIASKLSPVGADKDALSRAWQWKLDLDAGRKDKFDLFQELGKAPKGLRYVPGPSQMRFHQSKARTKQIVGGNRSGKSYAAAAELLPYMFRTDAHVWNVANSYTLATYEFDYVLGWLRWLNAPIVRLSTPSKGRYLLELEWGAILETQTADDPKVIEGAALDVANVAEAGQVDEFIALRVRARLADKRGDLLLSGSLDTSQNWYIEKFSDHLNGSVDGDGWESFGIPTWENLAVYPGGYNDPEIQKLKHDYPDALFKLKVAAEVSQPEEMVFSEFNKATHVVEMEITHPYGGTTPLDYPRPVFDELGMRIIKWRLPFRGDVMLAIDPGYNGAYAVLAVRKYDDLIFVIDEIYERQKTAQEVIALCKERSWWPDVRYAVMDIAGKQHQGMISHVEIWAEPEHLGFSPQTSYVHVTDGIHRLKTFLKNPGDHKPRVWFSPNCKGIIAEFPRYRYRFSSSRRAPSEEPIDSNNHSIKALEYLLMDRFGTVGRAFKTTSEKYVKTTLDDFREGGNRYRTLQDWALDIG